jgi:hypothetical protein
MYDLSMTEVPKQLVKYRKLIKVNAGLGLCCFLLFFLPTPAAYENPSLIYVQFALVIPCIALNLYLFIAKKDLVKLNREFETERRANIDPKTREKNYKRAVFAFPIFGIVSLVYGSFTNYVLPTIYSVVFIMSILWFIFGTMAFSIAQKAQEKGKDWTSFFWLTLLISPLLTWLIVSSIQPEHGKVLAGNIPCPMCAEPVKAAAKLCKHCGSSI